MQGDRPEYEIERSIVVKDLSTADVTTQDVRERMADEYGAGSMDRQFHITPIINAYGNIGSVAFSLEGTPPKGYALYIPEGNAVVFYNPSAMPYEKWEYVNMTFDQS